MLEVLAWIGIAVGAFTAVANLIKLRSGTRGDSLSRLNAGLLFCLSGLLLLQYSTKSQLMLSVAKIALIVLLAANIAGFIWSRIRRRRERIRSGSSPEKSG